jgi:hypothetical protein
MKRITVILAFIGLMVFASCKKEERDMSVVNKSLFDGTDFTEISVSDEWVVSIIQDDQNSGVELEYSAYLEEYLNVTQTGNAVSIGLNSVNKAHNTVTNVVIHTKSIEKLSLEGAVSVTMEGVFTGDHPTVEMKGASICCGGSIVGNQCEMKLQGSSTFKGDLTTDTVNIMLESSSRMITYGGNAFRVYLNVTKSSKLNMINTPVEEAFVTLENASEATLHANQLLQGTLKEASTLYFSGDPDINLDCDDTSMVLPL